MFSFVENLLALREENVTYALTGKHSSEVAKEIVEDTKERLLGIPVEKFEEIFKILGKAIADSSKSVKEFEKETKMLGKKIMISDVSYEPPKSKKRRKGPIK